MCVLSSTDILTDILTHTHKRVVIHGYLNLNTHPLNVSEGIFNIYIYLHIRVSATGVFSSVHMAADNSPLKCSTHGVGSIYIYIYIVIHRQTVSLYIYIYIYIYIYMYMYI